MRARGKGYTATVSCGDINTRGGAGERGGGQVGVEKKDTGRGRRIGRDNGWVSEGKMDSCVCGFGVFLVLLEGSGFS